MRNKSFSSSHLDTLLDWINKCKNQEGKHQNFKHTEQAQTKMQNKANISYKECQRYLLQNLEGNMQ